MWPLLFVGGLGTGFVLYLKGKISGMSAAERINQPNPNASGSIGTTNLIVLALYVGGILAVLKMASPFLKKLI